MTIEAYLEAIKERLVTDRHQLVIRQRLTLVAEHLRVRLRLADGSQIEFSEYMQRSRRGRLR